MHGLPAQVHFIVNNLSTANLESKGNALKDLLPKEFWPWFANYMVVKRAAQVPILVMQQSDNGIL